MKKLNYKVGALKRKFKNGKADFEPGTLISKVNESKDSIRNKDKKEAISKTRLAIMGLI